MFKNQQREIAHLQTFVDRFGAKASMASRAKSKEKQIARLEEVAIDEPEDDLKKIDAEIRAIVTEAAEFAQNDPEPDASELYTDIYVNA